MIRQTLRYLTVAALVTFAGCSSIMQCTLFGISERTVNRKVYVAVPKTGKDRIELSTEVPDGFLEFLADPAKFNSKRTAPPASVQERINAAVAVLRDPTVMSLVATSDKAIRGDPSERTLKLPTNRVGWTNLQQKLEDAALMDSWSALADWTQYYETSLTPEEDAEHENAPTRDEKKKAARLSKTAYYAKEYVRAYFSGMQLFRVKVDLSEFTKRMEESIKKRLKQLNPEIGDDELIKQLKEELEKELTSELQKLLKKDDLEKLGKILKSLIKGDPVEVFGWGLGTDSDAPVGFTSRAGENFKWPTVEISVDPSADDFVSWSDIDAKVIGAQLLRVFLEALFDAQLGVPGLASATGVGFEKEEYRLKEFVDANDGDLGVTTEQFNAINDWGGRVEGVASSAIGQLIRGIGWISLNNESLAGLIETAAGVMVRKLVEAALWKRYADDPEKGAADPFSGDHVRHVTIDFEFTDLSRPPDG